MCGIFGYVGNDENSVIKSLRGIKDLEYRGYDSWGVAVKTSRGIYSKKGVGKVSEIPEADFKNVKGMISLGHTRWATHGKVTKKNAHPHFNSNKTFCVVLNGIIENHKIIREELIKKHGKDIFLSDTDAEVIPHLIDHYIKEGSSFDTAFKKACKKLKGRFAFAVMGKDMPYLYAARNGSPLIVGCGDGGCYIASDTPAFLDYVNDVYFIKDNEYIRSDGKNIEFYNFKTNKKLKKKTSKINIEKTKAAKGGYEHFMLKEIMEQKKSLLRATEQEDSDIKKVLNIFKNKNKIFATGCGTALNMCIAGSYYFSLIANKEMHAISASEFYKNIPFINKNSLVVSVSQSGETADVLEAIRSIKNKKTKILSILNVRNSSMERASDIFLPINAGPEKAVASTKAASSQLVVLLLIAYALAGNYDKGKRFLKKSIKNIDKWLQKSLLNKIKNVAKKIVSNDDMYIIGKGTLYPIALEAAIKIKEISYIHAEGFASGELKHGPIALIEKGTPCIVLSSEDEHKNDILNSAEELKARGAFIVGISPSKSSIFDLWIEVPDLKEASSIGHLIATQILAYYLAVLRKLDPDMPRNLAKSVTVK